MNQLIKENVGIDNEIEIAQTSSDQFMSANTRSIPYNELKHKSIIPSFKDNESTISHTEFIDALGEVCDNFFLGERILSPAIRVSHPIRGRIPQAVGKPAKELKENEKTVYYERMAFVYEIPGISASINGNNHTLSVGGVRAYNQENLYSRKTEERFKVFIGFQNTVCINLSIFTDGLQDDMRIKTLAELKSEILKLFNGFKIESQINALDKLSEYELTEHQFACLLGRSRLYNFLPAADKKKITRLPLNDSQVSVIARGFYNDPNFARSRESGISLWNVYNLLTEAVKTSYIDSFLARNAGSTDFILHLVDSFDSGEQSWFLS
ncbi:MAG: DUF3871 family protein [Bacteroidales bacterium]|nr:DUF3871 family protein [Bacteroidales bacterium]